MAIFAAILGGIGLFLLGMTLMTDGLKTLGGNSLKRWLSKLTGGSVKAMLTGAGITTIIQSSAATTVTTIGFVSAGLLTFQQAIGIIFGANLGTTSTGWLVALLGFKFSIATLAFPIIGVGAFLKTFSTDRLSAIGTVLAGFGLIFVGIDTLQVGLADFSNSFDLSGFSADSFGSRLLLLLFGIIMTVALQSSSVAVAMTITALHTQAISLDQAGLLVIGQNVGTTFTSLIAVVGATKPAQRTAIAHIGFNVVTGILAFLIYPWFLRSVSVVSEWLGAHEPALFLAAFHTSFNVLGILVLLPAIRPFSLWIQRILPDDNLEITRHLDPSVAKIPAVAIEAARRTMIEVYSHIIGVFANNFRSPVSRKEINQLSDLVAQTLEETRQFLRSVKTAPQSEDGHRAHTMVLQAIDHLDSLLQRKLVPGTFNRLQKEPILAEMIDQCAHHLQLMQRLGQHRFDPETLAEVKQFSFSMAEMRRTKRLELIERTAEGALEPDAAQEIIEDLRWLDSLFFHLWKVREHLTEE
jgi:phosphate:Na+ symporter